MSFAGTSRRRRPRVAAFGLALLALIATGCSDSGHIRTLDRWSIAHGDSNQVRDVSLPTHFTAEDVPDHERYYRLTTTVRVPSEFRGRRLWFVEAQLPTRTALVVDGQDAVAIVAKPWDVAWVAGPQVFAIPRSATEDGILRLEWRISHSWPLSRWHDRVPELRRAGSIGRTALIAQTTSFYLSTILLGALIASALSCFAAILVDRRDEAHWWMLATAVAALPFSLFQAGILQRIVPHRYEFSLMLITLSLACFALGRFLSVRHRLELSTRWWIPFFGASVVMAIALRDDPFRSFLVQESLGSVCDMVATVPPTIALIRGLGTRDVDERRLTAWGLLIAVVFVTPDMLYFTGLGDFLGGGHMTLIGVLVVSTGVVQLLARGRAREIADANVALETQALELRDEQTRLGVLSAELEVQMSRGKSRLLEAVAAISSSHVPRVKLEPGNVVDERYRVLRTLGVGGMGSVFEVERISDGSRFALKIAHELDGASLARLAREALIGANVRSESIVEVVDIGIAREGFLFLVMEHFESRPLNDSKARFGDVSWATRVLAKVARALDAVHSAGIVHRDLKPSNVLLGGEDDPIVKLADFGISRFATEDLTEEMDAVQLGPITERPPHADRAQDEDDFLDEVAPTASSYGTPTNPDSLPDLTVAGQIAGTVGYMSPEAMASEVPTRAWDVFAFGVIAYLVLAGERPFESASDLLPGAETSGARRPDLVDRVTGIDRDLLEVLDACRAVDPAERPTIAEILDAFEDANAVQPS